MEFTAIDFETANENLHSACAVALVRVRNGKIAERLSTLIRPPPGPFTFTYIHGITRSAVRGAKTFDQLWPRIQAFCGAAPLLAAHNARFDRGVLLSCCDYYGIAPAPYPFACTVKAARAVWPELPRHSLDVVCGYLNIGLKHHEATSDAEACAHILLQAAQAGFPVGQLFMPPATRRRLESPGNSGRRASWRARRTR